MFMLRIFLINVNCCVEAGCERNCGLLGTEKDKTKKTTWKHELPRINSVSESRSNYERITS